MQPKKKIGNLLHFSHLNRMNLLGLESSGLNSNSKGKPFYTSESNTFIPVRNYARRESDDRLTPSKLTKNRGLIGVYAEISFFGNFI